MLVREDCQRHQRKRMNQGRGEQDHSLAKPVSGHTKEGTGDSGTNTDYGGSGSGIGERSRDGHHESEYSNDRHCEWETTHHRERIVGGA